MKRIFLFLATNLAIMITLSIVLSVLGVGGFITPSGLDYSALMVFSLVWGMGGAFISTAAPVRPSSIGSIAPSKRSPPVPACRCPKWASTTHPR
jgi:hypothetical protein